MAGNLQQQPTKYIMFYFIAQILNEFLYIFYWTKNMNKHFPAIMRWLFYFILFYFFLSYKFVLTIWNPAKKNMLICLHCNVYMDTEMGIRRKQRRKRMKKRHGLLFLCLIYAIPCKTPSALQHSHLEQMKFYGSAKRRNHVIVVIIYIKCARTRILAAQMMQNNIMKRCNVNCVRYF